MSTINMIASMFTEIEIAALWLFFWVTVFLSSFVIYTEGNLTIIACILAMYVWEPWDFLNSGLAKAHARYGMYWLAANGRINNILTFSFSCFLLLVACFQTFLFYKVIRAFIKVMILLAPRPPNTAKDISISAYLNTITHEVLQRLGLDLHTPKISPSTTIKLKLLFWTTGIGLCTFLATKDNLSAMILFLAPYMDPIEPSVRAVATTSDHPSWSNLMANEILIWRAYNLPLNRPLTMTFFSYRVCLSVATVMILYKFSMTLETILVEKWNEGKAHRKLMEMVKIILDQNDIEHIDIYVRRTSDIKGLFREAWFNWRNDTDPLEY